MVDTKFVVIQVQKFQVIINDLLLKDLVINEAFQVVAMIKKLPHLWKDFKNYLKHKRNEMSLEDILIRWRIEKDNKAAEKRSRENSTIQEPIQLKMKGIRRERQTLYNKVVDLKEIQR